MITNVNNRCPQLVIIGDYLFDPVAGLISGPSGAHYISPHLASLLCDLLENAGNVVQNDRLFRKQHDHQGDNSKSLAGRIGRLKRYFADNAHPPSYIETVPGKGYRLVAPVFGSTQTAVIDHRPEAGRTAPRSNRLVRLINEFRERKVGRAMLVYSLVIWLVFQVSEIMVPALRLPDWVNTLVVVLGILGFPVAASLSWIFDLTPQGLVRGNTSASMPYGLPRKRGDYAMDFVLVAAALAICTMLVVSSQSPGPTDAQAEPMSAPPSGSVYSESPGHAYSGAI